MCKYLKSSKVVEPVMKYVHEYVQSPNAHARKAAISALTVLVRNCSDALQEKLSALLPYVSVSAVKCNTVSYRLFFSCTRVSPTMMFVSAR
jgi:vesicle coat complex subunit